MQILRIIAVQFEFALEILKTFLATPIRFCGKFLTTVNMVHHVEIDKIESFLRTKPYPFKPKVQDDDIYRYLKYYHPLGAPNLSCHSKFVTWLLRK